MHRGDDPAHGINREYATDLFTEEAIKIIENHELLRPLYLQISHLAVHAPLEQPDNRYNDREIVHIREPNRHKYASTYTGSINEDIQTSPRVSLNKMIEILEYCLVHFLF